MDIEKIERRIKDHFDDYELFVLKEKTKKFESRDGDIYGADLAVEEGVALRAVKDGKMVFSYTYETGDKGAELLLENATMLTSFSEADADRIIPLPSTNYPLLSIHDDEGLTVDDREKIALLVDMEKTIRNYDHRIAATRNCELQESDVHVTIINSRGLSVEASKTLYSLFALCVAKDKDEVSWYDWTWAHRLGDLDGRKLAAGIAGKTISFLGSEQIETGQYAGILTPQTASDILGILAGSFLGENLFKNKTKLRDKVGMKCFSDLLTIIDSGTKGMGSFPCDGEGVASKETAVVQQGRFETFLYDVYYGQKFGRSSTGNSVRDGLSEAPRNAPRCLFVAPGERNIADNLSDGIIVEELMGAHTANPITGDFSLGAIGYRCKGGQKKPFKGVIFSGNVFELLNNVREVGKDLRFYGSTGSPSLYVEGLRISGI
jgi:PmbA protein